MFLLNHPELASLLIKTVKKAGKVIIEKYDNKDLNIKLKGDKSPVTDADIASNKVITKALSNTGIPILSEESEVQNFQIRKKWKRYWLIDPLDGTKEFINRNGDFTINIALIEDNIPTLGVVSIPVSGTIYIGGKSLGYSKMFNDNEETVLKTNPKISTADILKYNSLRVVASRSHRNPKLDQFLESFNFINLRRLGSSLKFMSIVSQNADIYPRFSPCMEWDTAASDAILRELGYQIRSISESFEIGDKLAYNKKNLENPAFIAY